jgi:hypothetical protein
MVFSRVSLSIWRGRQLVKEGEVKKKKLRGTRVEIR